MLLNHGSSDHDTNMCICLYTYIHTYIYRQMHTAFISNVHVQEMRKDISKVVDPVDFSDSERQRNSFLYGMLSALLRQRPLLVLRQVSGSNRLEAQSVQFQWWSSCGISLHCDSGDDFSCDECFCGNTQAEVMEHVITGAVG